MRRESGTCVPVSRTVQRERREWVEEAQAASLYRGRSINHPTSLPPITALVPAHDAYLDSVILFYFCVEFSTFCEKYLGEGIFCRQYHFGKKAPKRKMFSSIIRQKSPELPLQREKVLNIFLHSYFEYRQIWLNIVCTIAT
jgi:hypothetical protein